MKISAAKEKKRKILLQQLLQIFSNNKPLLFFFYPLFFFTVLVAAAGRSRNKDDLMTATKFCFDIAMGKRGEPIAMPHTQKEKKRKHTTTVYPHLKKNKKSATQHTQQRNGSTSSLPQEECLSFSG